jgi:quinoprotein relay system zinc metallohydrolase 2
LCAGACAAALLLASSANPAPAAQAQEPALAVTEVAEGVFVHTGAQQEPDRHNLGAIANIGFVIGSKCVAVIDTGGSVIVGARLKAALRTKTQLPVCYVINTHVHPDHVFGNAAFIDDKPVFVGHARLPAAMAARGGNYRNALIRDLGPAVEGSTIVPPSLTVTETTDLDLGGRLLKLRAWRTAHTDNDLTVLDEKTGTLWLSDLLFVRRIPALDGSLRGWLAVIEELKRFEPRKVIAGHGDAGAAWREAMAEQERYLRVLLDETRAAIRAKRTIQQAVAEVGTAEKDKWLLYDNFHRRNVTASYAELEWED